MNLEVEIENEEGSFVCNECLSQWNVDLLKDHPICFVEERSCSGCNKKIKNGLGARKIANRISAGLKNHFTPANGENIECKITLSDAIGLMIECCNENTREALVAHLENSEPNKNGFFLPGQKYIKNKEGIYDHDSAAKHWREIADKLIHEQRFFNSTVHESFSWLIDEACEFKNPEKQDQPLVATTLESGTYFYRARIARNNEEAQSFIKNPRDELGAPPRRQAASNRMSPAGIPLLYVAKEVKTCIAEVRPSIEDVVVVGEFELENPLVFFDFTMLDMYNPTTPHKLDLNYFDRMKFQALLRFLHKEISRIALIADVDYLVTQALAEFICYYKKSVKFDGIAFRSAQQEGGVNYVVFDKVRQDIKLNQTSIYKIKKVEYLSEAVKDI